MVEIPNIYISIAIILLLCDSKTLNLSNEKWEIVVEICPVTVDEPSSRQTGDDGIRR